MRRAGGLHLSAVAPTAVPTLGLISLLAVRWLSPRPLRAAPESTRTLVLSGQARRYLALPFRAYAAEFLGCMMGDVRGGTVLIRRIAPADVELAQPTPTRVMPKETCEKAAWKGTVGMIHSHPGGERCFYLFPGTQVASADPQSFALQAYPVDAIMCGDSVVWVNRDLVQRELPIPDGPVPPARALDPGNRVLEGSRTAMRTAGAP